MNKYELFVIIAGICSGAIIFGGKVLSDKISLYQLSIIPMIISLIIILPIVLWKKLFTVQKKDFAILALYGIVSSIIIVSQFGALYLGASVSLVVILLYTQPLWTILISKIFLKEQPSKNQILACMLVIIGAITIINPFRDLKSSILGIIVALIAGIALSSWFIVGSVLSKRNIHPLKSKFFESIFSVIIIILVFELINIYSQNKFQLLNIESSMNLWIMIIIFSIIAFVLNPLFYLYGVKKVSPITAGIIMLIEPIIAFALSIIFLDEKLTINLIIGSIFILIGNYLVIEKNYKSK